ncbi:chitinase-3-like protein 1 [Ostrea edulis]|uniref:chitinase-3-like protein 1 n=1 Tax=Ostrea edulis TaxID=37623 RepID=UPI0024AF7D72|nr:chitinase-3-like protein 1 [Ostrea edulis]
MNTMTEFLKRVVFKVLLWITITLYIDAEEFKRVCYYTNWSENRAVVQSRFHLKQHLDPSLCTHLIYAFAKINSPQFRLEWTYPTEDDGKLPGSGLMYDFTGLKKRNPNLKTILSIGGETSSANFNLIMGSNKNIQTFAQNIYIYIKHRHFDGIDVDWEYPGVTYKHEFVQFLKVLRSVFAEKARQTGSDEKLITIATAPGASNIETSYDIPEIIKYVDFINVMAYDYFGSWSSVTGFMAPLYSRYSNKNFDHTLSQNWTMNKYLELGVPPEKLVMGLHGAGATFTLANNSKHDVGDAVSHPGNEGSLLKLESRKSYPEICITTKDEIVLDQEQKQKYSYHQSQWVGYEDPDTIELKVKYAITNKFGGVMFWSLDLDDFNGNYCHQGKYPLLSKIKAISQNLSLVPATHAPNQKSTTVWPPKNDGFKLYIIDSRNATSTRKFSYIILMLSLCVLFVIQ